MKHVVFLDQYKEIGGGQIVLIECVRTFYELGWSVTVLIPFGGELEHRLRAIGTINLIHIPELNLQQGQKGFIDIFKVLLHGTQSLNVIPKLSNCDLVIVNGPRLWPLMLATTRFSKAKFVYYIHLEHTKKQKSLLALLAQLPNTYKVIANSQTTFDGLKDLFNSKKIINKLLMIPNALRTEFAGLDLLPQSKMPLKFVSIGRITREKGQDVIVELAQRHPEIEVHLIGGTDFAQTDFEKNLREDAPQNVIFANNVQNIPKYIYDHKINAAILASRVAESFGLAGIETMACGCFTILRNLGELSNIAKTTGAWTFNYDFELNEIYEMLLKLTETEFLDSAKKQRELTLKHYEPTRYKNDIKSKLLEECQ